MSGCCEKRKRPSFDILMGVGAKYYPTPAFFIEECLRLGLSKRLPDWPEFFDCKQSKMWLVHWSNRRIFGFDKGLVLRVYVPEETDVCKDLKKKYGDECVLCAPPGSLAGDDTLRGCGYANPRGRYARKIA